MNKKRLPALAGATLLLAAPAVAANDTAPDTLHLKEVTYTTPKKTSAELTPMDVTIVNRTEIERSAESSLLPVLTNNVAGMFVSERGFAGYGVSGGAAGTVNIRGVGGGNKVLFMIDGQPQWAGLFGHSLPDTYVANGVERVEVVKGPSSLLYGSGAMGGSVNIITTKQQRDGITGRARAMFGSFATQKMTLSTGIKKGRFSATVAGQLDRSNGNREGSDFWLANEYIQMQYTASDHWNIGANADLTQTKANNPGTLQSPLLSMWTYVKRGTASVYAGNRYEHFNGGAQAYISWGRHKIDDGYAPGGNPRATLFNSTDYNAGFSLFETVNPWEAGDISLGLDFQHWGGHSWNTDKTDPSKETNDFHEGENEVAGYVMMQQGFFDNRFSLNAGVRLQHGSQYGNILVPQAGAIYHPAEHSDIKFSFSKGFRSPNIRELYLYASANPDLKPEYMYNYELSYSQLLLDNHLRLGAALYYIDGKDMIQVERIYGHPRNMNVGAFHNKGFELEASYIFSTALRASANYAYLHTDNATIYAPKNTLNAELTYTRGPLSVTLQDRSVWSLRNGAPNNATSSYTLVNLRASYTVAPATYFIKLDNIFNRHYEITYGCPMPGTTILGGVELKF